mmetsp:Transcript_34848/g.81410  ORF Transcript_34848/g.81410 Transcript_34848/m.81410 type:complete len:273 (-) Transcript_34848:42-860(-)
MSAALSSKLAEIFRDRGVRWVLGGWALFTVENIILSENRDWIRRSWGGGGGQGAYQGFYSIFSAATLGSTIYGYSNYARFGVQVRSAPVLSTHFVAFLWRAAGLVTLSQLGPPVNLQAATIAMGVQAPPSEDLPPAVRHNALCPFDFNAQRQQGDFYGIVRVTRRPELWGLAAVGVGGALLSTTATQVCFFAVGPIMSFSILSLHADRVQRMSGDLSEEKARLTSSFPFVAILDGRQSVLALRDELVQSNAGLAIAIAALCSLRPSWMRWVK